MFKLNLICFTAKNTDYKNQFCKKKTIYKANRYNILYPVFSNLLKPYHLRYFF